MTCGQLYKTWTKEIQWLNHGYLQNSDNFLDSDCIKKYIQIVVQTDIQLDKMLDNFNRALRGRLRLLECNGFTYVNPSRGFKNLLLIKYMPFEDDPPHCFSQFLLF